MDDIEPPTAEYYRDKAQEIRHVARRARNPEVAGELLELSVRFDRMAAYADKRKLSEAAARNGGTMRPQDYHSRLWELRNQYGTTGERR
jgi:hypothetical protein